LFFGITSKKDCKDKYHFLKYKSPKNICSGISLNMNITYKISCQNPLSQFIQIEMEFEINQLASVLLQLPAWRAGKYQLANYAQNIRKFQILDPEGCAVQFEKMTKDAWTFTPSKVGKYTVRYDYYAAKMDAGSCWVDEEQIYLNFVNCCLELKKSGNRELLVELDFPNYPQTVTTLERKNDQTLFASDFQQLADSTLLAAKKLTHWEFQLQAVNFHIWIHGEIHFSNAKLIQNFKRFASAQIRDFGEFPEQEYHFIFQLLPYKHYHGVEHRKGTVITFGPAKSLKDPRQMDELLGVSSHELYHAWNVCRIRPKELLPYDFSKEVYTKAGWVLEGITSYMGDLYLLKSGVYSLENYLKNLEKIINRESQHFGWQNQHILESSFDLWLDGYQEGIPNRKVSIYSHGALINLCLDIKLLLAGSSLAKVMRHAWTKFGKAESGYSDRNFWQLITNQIDDKEDLSDFYNKYICGYQDILKELKELLPKIGLNLKSEQNPDVLAHNLGVISDAGKITKIHPESPAIDKLMIGDHISFEKVENQFVIKAERINGNTYNFNLSIQEYSFYPNLKLEKSIEANLRDLWMV